MIYVQRSHLQSQQQRRTINYIRNKFGKLANIENKIKFFNRCIAYEMFPKFISNTVNCRSVNFSNSNDILRNRFDSHSTKYKQKILKLHQKDAYRERTLIERDIKTNLDRLERNIDEHQVLRLNKIFKSTYDKSFIEARISYNNKFNKLENNQVQRYYDLLKDSEQFIENLSDIQIPENVKRGLILGPKFAFALKEQKNIISLVADVEAIIDRLKDTRTKNIIRNKILTVIQNQINKNKKPTKLHNVIKNDILATIKFKKEFRHAVVIVSSDKSNKTVICNREQYDDKVDDIIRDENKYQKITRYKDPIKNSEKNICKFVDKIRDLNMISSECHKVLKPKNSNPGFMYFTIKTHKPEKPLRPIITAYGTPNFNLSKYLGKILNQLTNNNNRVKNSAEVISRLKNTTIKQEQCLLSFDIKNLFPNLPITMIKDIIDDRWPEIRTYTDMSKKMFLEAFDICTNSNIFKLKDQYYSQVSGTPIGGPISSVLADLLIDLIHEKVFKNYSPQIVLYYVDDSFCIIEKEKIDTLLLDLNSVHDNISYTYELEENNQINFLDITIKRDSLGNLTTENYKKPEKSLRTINFFSQHPAHQKKNLITNELSRIQSTTCNELLPKHIKLLKEKFMSNGYPVDFIESCINNKNNRIKKEKNNTSLIKGSITYIPGISNIIKRYLNDVNINVVYSIKKPLAMIINNKDPIDKLDLKNVIYGIKCLTCKSENNENSMYIGQTSREIKVRLKEHFRSLTNNVHTALSKHADDGHSFDFDNFVILGQEQNLSKRLFLESLYINIYDNESINYRVDRERSQVVFGNLVQKSKMNCYNSKIFN